MNHLVNVPCLPYTGAVQLKQENCLLTRDRAAICLPTRDRAQNYPAHSCQGQSSLEGKAPLLKYS